MRKNILFLILIILVSGCSNEQQISKETLMPSIKESPDTIKSPPTLTATPTPLPASTPVPTTAATPKSTQTPTTTQAPVPTMSKIIIGTFAYPWSNPRDLGTAVVTKSGSNKYHLHVEVFQGFSVHMGEIDSDFTYDGKNTIFSNDAYKDVTLVFSENALTIDYPGDGFGGANAEPKGTFYLKNSGAEDAPFLTNLYNKIKLPEEYRHGKTDVLAYNFNEAQQLLLIRSKYQTQIAEENLVLYDPLHQEMDDLGTVNHYDGPEISKKLADLQVDPELIYVLLHKDYSDRFIEVQMQRFFDGDRTVFEPSQFKLTEAEAFYIATGIENATSISNNTRNADNIGSIFISEVDNSNEKSVLVHIYELVRNDEEDTHTATYDWLEVNRSTGKVKSMLFD